MPKVVKFRVLAENWEIRHGTTNGRPVASFWRADSGYAFSVRERALIRTLRSKKCCCRLVLGYLAGRFAGERIGESRLARQLRYLLGAAPASGAGT